MHKPIIRIWFQIFCSIIFEEGFKLRAKDKDSNRRPINQTVDLWYAIRFNSHNATSNKCMYISVQDYSLAWRALPLCTTIIMQSYHKLWGISFIWLQWLNISKSHQVLQHVYKIAHIMVMNISYKFQDMFLLLFGIYYFIPSKYKNGFIFWKYLSCAIRIQEW